ncbi:hypothetical protein [Thiobacillus denitrificans]|uniref:hypothetical protein n=1 Tax=Thiobacillus denitrificans TaxID=36861 RepID=UPI00138F68DB|nr:hypothetical protein [Thiobacillus denitrificans]
MGGVRRPLGNSKKRIVKARFPQESMEMHHAIFQRRQPRPGFRVALLMQREPRHDGDLKPGRHKLSAGPGRKSTDMLITVKAPG